MKIGTDENHVGVEIVQPSGIGGIHVFDDRDVPGWRPGEGNGVDAVLAEGCPDLGFDTTERFR